MADKPKLVLIEGVPTIEQIAAMFEALTGRKPTPEDMAQCEALLREHEGALGRREHDGDGDAGKMRPKGGGTRPFLSCGSFTTAVRTFRVTVVHTRGHALSVRQACYRLLV